MNKIITTFTGKYGLTKSEAMVEIEKVFSSVLSQWYHLEVMVFFREDLKLEAVAYDKTGGVTMQRIVDLRELRGSKTLQRHLEINLAKAAVLKLTQLYKTHEKELHWGEIIGCDSEMNLHVETEIIPGKKVIATCPLNRIGLHERESQHFSIGQKRAFHLRRVEPVLLNDTPRLKIVVDRVSKTLVETLLRNHLGCDTEKVKIHCAKRYVGHKSFVLATRRLPKSAIIAVTQELQERVQVRFVENFG